MSAQDNDEVRQEAFAKMKMVHDTHFATFARLLLRELLDEGGENPPSIENWDEHFEAHWTHILAGRAFDLACHVVDEASQRDMWMVRAGLDSIMQVVAEISDVTENLTEWEPTE